MKLKGYITALKENCFTIPIYGDGVSYYYHNIDDSFNIISFDETEVEDIYFTKVYLSKTFEVNAKGAIVLIGVDNFVLSNSVDVIIDEVLNYLDDTTNVGEYLNIKKEALELKKIIAENDDINRNKTNDVSLVIDFDDVSQNFNLNNNDAIKYSLESYMEMEDFLLQNRYLFDIKEKIIKKNIEKSILDNELYNKNKEVLFSLFHNYLSENKLIFERIIMNTNIGKSFTSYLSNKSESYKPIELSIEETLATRVEERRSKLKEFNYKFHKNSNSIDYYSSEPAYKRYGIDVTSMPYTLNSNKSSFVILIDDKIISEEIKQVEREKVSR